MSSKVYDFIIVGGGTAGCLLAHRLSHAPARPSVLLVEAGSNPTGEELEATYYRYMVPALRPELDWAYESTPQKELNNRVIPYSRGKGLGGSSLLNFQVYLYGSQEDYNRWAELVGDDDWKWENVKESFKKIEDFEFEGAKAYSHLANPVPEAHGKGGTVKVCLPPILEKGIAPVMEVVAEKSGDKINLDFNTGDPIGIGIFPSSTSKDGRTTSATAHLIAKPDNLEVWTDAAVHKLVFEGTRVVGIEARDGRKAQTSKEVIVCCGAIDSPKLLLLNGIGPASELQALDIQVVKDLPGAGKHLLDHVMTFLSVETDGSQNDRWKFQSNEKMVEEAKALWQKDKSGNFALHTGVLWGGFLKLPGHQDFPEYKALDEGWREYLAKETVPSYEFVGSALLWPPDTVLPEDSSYMSAIAFMMNPLSEGSVTLRSSNPDDKPLIDLAYLSHPHDRRVMREAIRETSTKLFDNPDVKKHIKRQIYGPASLSDSDIDEFMREAAITVWHASGSLKMGKSSDPLACVDANLRVRGVEGLRVADVSVCPLTTNNHTQATAYLIAQKAADRLVAEYSLGERSRL